MLDYRRIPSGKDRFFKKEGILYQRSAVEPDKSWELVQVLDSVTPGNPRFNPKASLSKTLLRDGKTWGTASSESQLAHANSNMTCYSCHSSWVPSCFGCHLKMEANQKRPMLHTTRG